MSHRAPANKHLPLSHTGPRHEEPQQGMFALRPQRDGSEFLIVPRARRTERLGAICHLYVCADQHVIAVTNPSHLAP